MCTGIKIVSKTNDIFYGRTMDFIFDFFGKEDPNAHSVLGVIAQFPKNLKLNSQLKSWTSKYAFMGVTLSGSDQKTESLGEVSLCLLDGINEKGLTGDVQYLVEATFASEKNLKERNLSPILAEEVLAYILSQFETVEEVKIKFQQIGLVDQKYHTEKLGDVQFPLHWTINDKYNHSIILEPTDNGAFKIYDSIGVVTNSPEYSYHLNSIRNYIGIRNYSITTPYTLKSGESITPIENGTSYGLLGIPGDYTSPSRFIRALYYSDNLQEFESSEGIMQLYRAFQPVMIPRGLGQKSETNLISDFTHYWSGYDVTHLKMYIQPSTTSTFTECTLNCKLKKFVPLMSQMNYLLLKSDKRLILFLVHCYE